MAHFFQNLKHYNVCVLGETGVGKSSLIIQFLQSYFADDFDPTLQDTYSRAITLDDNESKDIHNIENNAHRQSISRSPSPSSHIQSHQSSYILDVLDTVGIEDYSDLRENQIQEADAIVLCYNVTSKESYDIVTLLHQQVLRCRDEDDLPPIILCGTMSDLTEERQLTTHDAELLVKELHLNFFLETSAKLKVNVEELFVRVLQEILKSKLAKEQEKSNSASMLIASPQPNSSHVTLTKTKSASEPQNSQRDINLPNLANKSNSHQLIDNVTSSGQTQTQKVPDNGEAPSATPRDVQSRNEPSQSTNTKALTRELQKEENQKNRCCIVM